MNRGSGWVARHLGGLSVVLVLILTLTSLGAILPVASAPPGATSTGSSDRPGAAVPAGTLAGSDWPTYLGEVTRDAANTGESILSPSDASQLKLLWDYPTGSYVQSSPAIVNGTVFIGSTDGYEYALNSTTGILKWKNFTGIEAPTPCGPSIGITSSATVAGGSVYFGGGDGYYYTLNQQTGTQEWKFFVGNTSMGYYNWESPLIADGFEYIGAASKCDNPLVHGGLWQVSLTTHKGIFFNTTPPGTLGTSVWGSPSFDAATNTIFFATGNPLKNVTTALSESVIALNASTMKFLGSWQVPAFQVHKDGDFGNTPTLFTTAKGAQLLAITNKNGYTYVLNRSNLSKGPVWEYLTSNNISGLYPDVGPAAYGGGLLYVPGTNTTVNGVDYGGTVRAFNPNSATPSVPVWVNPEPLDVFGAPAYENGVLVVASSNQVQVLDASTGHQLWNDTTCLKKHVAAPSIAHGIIYVACTNRYVYAYGLKHAPPQYTVTFQEAGLPAGLTWNVYFAGGAQGTSSSSLSFQVGNGTWNFTVLPPAGYSVSPRIGIVDVMGAGKTVGLTFALVKYPVTFSETGLPPGTMWSVTLALASNSSIGSSIGFSDPNGSYAFTVGPVPSYRASPPSGTVVLVGAGMKQGVVFTPSSQNEYSMTFAEAGLPAGTSWSVVLSNSTMSSKQSSVTAQVVFDEPNGTYNYSIPSIPGYVPTPASGSLTVNGGPPATVSVVFAPFAYNVTFTETGTTQKWSVTIGGNTWITTGNRIVVSEPNGTHSFVVGSPPGLEASPPSGTFTVNGNPISQSIAFHAVSTYTVTFTASGLPSGLSWSVSLNHSTQSSTTNQIFFTESNGTYSFSVGSEAGYIATPSSSQVTVNGAGVTEPILWSLVEYSVSFVETGLHSGTGWSVTLKNLIVSSTLRQLGFNEPNGTYSFAVGSISGYHANPVSGQVTVNGQSVQRNITWAANSTAGTNSLFLGLSTPMVYLVVIVAGIAVAGAAVALALRGRSRLEGSKPIPPPTPPGPAS